MCTTATPSVCARLRSRSVTSVRPSGSSIAVASSLIITAGRRASRAATARRCSSPPESVAVSRSPAPREPDAGEQLVDGHGVPGRQAPAQVVGDAHAEHLAVGALEHHAGAADDAEPRVAGSLGGAALGRAPGDHPRERRLPGPVRPGHRDEPAGLEVEVHGRPGGQGDPAQVQRQRGHGLPRAPDGQAPGEVGGQEALHGAQRLARARAPRRPPRPASRRRRGRGSTPTSSR